MRFINKRKEIICSVTKEREAYDLLASFNILFGKHCRWMASNWSRDYCSKFFPEFCVFRILTGLCALCNVKDQRSTPGFITYANIKILDGLFRHLESKPHTIEGGRRRRISGSRAALSTSVSVNNVQTFLGNSKQIFIHVRRLVIGGSMILSDPKWAEII